MRREGTGQDCPAPSLYGCCPALATRQIAHGVCYMVRAYARRVQKLFGLTRAWHVFHGEVLEEEGVGFTGECGQNGLAESAFRPVVLDRDDVAPGCPGGGAQCLGVYRLDGVGVYDAYGYAALLQLVCSLYGFVDRDARGDHGHRVVVRGAKQFAAA